MTNGKTSRERLRNRGIGCTSDGFGRVEWRSEQVNSNGEA
jgi:hypothetical protein